MQEIIIFSRKILSKNFIKKFNGKIINNTLTVGATSYPEHGNNIYDLYKKTQKVLDYCNENDISGYMIYEENKHNH